MHSSYLKTTSICLIIAAGMAVAWTTLVSAKEPKLQWQNDLQAAHKLSVSSNQPMLIVFGADWCGYCKLLEQKTLRSRQVAQQIEDSFIPVSLNFDDERRIAKILEIESLPATVILSPEADLLGRSIGYSEPAEYGEVLRKSLQLHQKIQQASGTATK